MKPLNDHEAEIREAFLEGAGIELIEDPAYGYYLRVGVLPVVVKGRTPGECLLNLADIVTTPVGAVEQ